MSSKHLDSTSSCPVHVKKDIPRFYTMRFCPFTHRVALVAAIKNISLDTVYINLTDKPLWYLKKYPKGLVPALEYNDHIIIESLICSQFLDDLYPNNKLTPTDPYVKAKHSLLLEEFGKITTGILLLQIKDYTEKYLNECLELFKPFENELAKEKTNFFGGNKVGMLDLMMWPWFVRFPLMKAVGSIFDIPENKFPYLCKWQQNMKEDEDVAKASFDEKQFINFVETKFAGNPVYDS